MTRIATPFKPQLTVCCPKLSNTPGSAKQTVHYYDRARQACEQAMARYDQLAILLQLLRETLHLCSPLGRLRTVEGVRTDVTHLLEMIQEVDDERMAKLLKPILKAFHVFTLRPEKNTSL